MLTMQSITRRILSVSVVAICLAAAATSAQAADQTVLVHVKDTATHMPSLLRGDTEFGGNGPRVTVFVKFYVQNNAVYRRIGMWAFETKGNTPSIAKGMSAPELVCTAPPGKTIKAVGGLDGNSGPIQFSSKERVLEKTMSGHDSYTAPRTAVGRITVWGDRRGKDVGFHTRVMINFDYRLPVVISDQVASRVTAQLPKTITVMPKLIQGDPDFHSNGPDLAVHTNLSHTDTVAQFSIVMTASETAPGTTLAHGVRTVTFYRAPQGYRIKSILGGGRSFNMIKYTDRDLTPNFFNTQFGRVAVYGDHNGPDVGTYTRVVFENIQRPIIINLERM